MRTRDLLVTDAGAHARFLPIDLLDIPASVNAEALADLKVAGKLTSNVNLGLALDALGANIDLTLTPLGVS